MTAFPAIALLFPRGQLHSSGREGLPYGGVLEFTKEGVVWEGVWGLSDQHASPALHAKVSEGLKELHPKLYRHGAPEGRGGTISTEPIKVPFPLLLDPE